MEQEIDYYTMALQYRNGLDEIYELLSKSLKCDCQYRPNWMTLMDIGVRYDSTDLRENGVVCVACKVEYMYANAIGEELFNELCSAKINQYLFERFKEPILVQFEEPDGRIESRFMEKDVYEQMIQAMKDEGEF